MMLISEELSVFFFEHSESNVLKVESTVVDRKAGWNVDLYVVLKVQGYI